MRNAWPCTVRKMVNPSCIDSEIFYKTLSEVRASKKTKASIITLFIDDNFYNDAVKWLETRNKDSKERTNLTSPNIAIQYQKTRMETGGWQNMIQERKRNCSKMSTTASSLPSPFEYCVQSKSQDRQVYQVKLRVSIPRSNTTLCVTLRSTRRTKVDHQQAKTACASPYSSKRIPNTFANGPNGPSKLTMYMFMSSQAQLGSVHMIDHFTNYSWLYPLKNKQAEDVLECVSQFCWQFSENTQKLHSDSDILWCPNSARTTASLNFMELPETNNSRFGG